MLKYKTTPRLHQREALEKSWDKTSFALLMDRGTGKTKVIIDNAAMLYERKRIQALLVIAPNDVHIQWIEEQIPIHMPNHINYMVRTWLPLNTKKYIKTLHDLFKGDELKIMTMNIEAFQSKKGTNFANNFCNKLVTLLTVDESTRIKSPSAKRTKSIIALGKRAPYKRILTGCEITKWPFDVYSQFKFLNPNIWNCNFHVFKHRYAKFTDGFASVKKTKKESICEHCKKKSKQKVIRFFNRHTDEWDCYFKCSICDKDLELTGEMLKIKSDKGLYTFPVLTEYQNLDELKTIVNSYSFRAKKEECLDLPEKIYMPIYTEMNQKQVNVYETLTKDFYAEHEGQELTLKHKLTLSMRQQQIVGGFLPTDEGESIYLGSPKLDRLIYDLEDIDDKVIIIWAIFRAELELLWKEIKKLDPRTELFYGSTPKKRRKEIIKDFQNGEIKYFIGNPSTAGTGLNLQRSCLHYYYSNSFKAEDRWQSEDRSHRDGTIHNVTYRDIFIKGTIDDTIQKSTQDKKDLADFFRK